MMDDSSSFSSLSDLINSHLSKPEVQASGSESQVDQLIRHACSMVQPRRFIIPSLNINSKAPEASAILVKQVTNAMRAQGDLDLNMESGDKVINGNLENKDDTIDLMKCLKRPQDLEELKRSVSPDFLEIEFKGDLEEYVFDNHQKPQCPILPCVLNGYPIKKLGKPTSTCSTIGRALCTKFLEFQVPYIHDKIETDIVRFDFSTSSPDDIIKQSRKKITMEK